jgi:DNA-binding transcriptional ArsR family regulator
MNIGFDSVRALASPTRLEILSIVLNEDEATTTKISDELGKSKSTVSSHLKVLKEADLLEKDEEEGRRRVIYNPTDKSKAIVEGKERKVKFSITSSALTAAGGAILLSRGLTGLTGKVGERIPGAASSEESGTMGTMDSGGQGAETGEAGQVMAESVNQTSQNATQITQFIQSISEGSLVLFGGLLVLIALLLLAYTAVLRGIKLKK